MKTLTRITLLTLGLATAALPMFAGDAASPAAGRHPRLRQLLVRRHALRQRIVQRLGLTADQKTQIQAERTKIRAAVQGIRADPALTREQKRAKLRETLQAARTEIRGVLTEQQQQQVRQLRHRLRARFGRGE